MRINRAAHIPWAMFVLVATGLASLFYVTKFYPQRVPRGLRLFGEIPPDHATVGGTPLGLIFGALSLGIFVFAALLGVRKKWPILRIGDVKAWLRGHIWLTVLTVPLILLHSGFQLGGPMTTLLMALYAVVMLSGFYGLFLQHRMPTLMKENLTAEIVYEQIPNIRAQLCAAAKRLQKTYQPQAAGRLAERAESAALPTALTTAEMPDVSMYAVLKTPSAAEKLMESVTVRGARLSPEAIEVASAGADPVTDPASETVLADFIEHELMPYLEARRGEKFRLGHARQAEDTYRHLKLRVAGAYQAQVEDMRGWCDERRLLDAQTRMQHRLHGWLFIHVPLSFLLLLLTGWHAFVTLFRY